METKSTRKLALPIRKQGRQSQSAKIEYEKAYLQFAADLQEIAKTVGFKISARGWCYHLEGENLIDKSQFDLSEALINKMRKDGTLPIDFTSVDASRSATGIPTLDYSNSTVELSYQREQVEDFIRHRYTPHLLCDTTKTYIELAVEKKDLVSLYAPTCKRYQIPVSNFKGWSDINSRAKLVKRCYDKHKKGYRVVVLYCGDFDPAGINISDAFRKNLRDLEHALGIDTAFMGFERFGLNHNYIIENDLVWTDNLMTGSGKDLAKQSHPDHKKPYVQDYLKKYGSRKVEANALLKQTDKARELLLNAIYNHISNEDVEAYEKSLLEPRRKLLEEFRSQWRAA